MKKVLFIILISCFSLTIISCSEEKEESSATGNTDNTTTTSSDSTASFLAVGQSGRILTSSNGTSWDNRSSGTTSNLIGVTYGNSKFLTLTGSMYSNSVATILTSSDGTTWNSSNSVTCSSCEDNSSNFSLNDVTYGNSTYVAVGQSGRILTSSNGTSWDNRSSGTSSNLIGVTYGNSKFLTLTGSMDNDTAATILTSSDGTTWTSTSVTCSSCADNSSTISLNDVTYAE